MKILAISNYKGGVGKTTSTANIGAELARAGLRVLLVDMDPQGSLTFSVGGDAAPHTLAEAILEDKPAQPFPVWENVDLLAADRQMVRVELATKSRDIMANVLKPLKKKYDVALLDCPPHFGILHLSALASADHIITPMEPEFLGLKGYKDYMAALEDMGLPAGLVFITKYDTRKALHRTIQSMVRIELGKQVMQAVIRSNVALAEAPGTHKPVREHSPTSAGAADYMALADELVQRLKLA